MFTTAQQAPQPHALGATNYFSRKHINCVWLRVCSAIEQCSANVIHLNLIVESRVLVIVYNSRAKFKEEHAYSVTMQRLYFKNMRGERVKTKCAKNVRGDLITKINSFYNYKLNANTTCLYNLQVHLKEQNGKAASLYIPSHVQRAHSYDSAFVTSPSFEIRRVFIGKGHKILS